MGRPGVGGGGSHSSSGHRVGGSSHSYSSHSSHSSGGHRPTGGGSHSSYGNYGSHGPAGHGPGGYGHSGYGPGRYGNHGPGAPMGPGRIPNGLPNIPRRGRRRGNCFSIIVILVVVLVMVTMVRKGNFQRFFGNNSSSQTTQTIQTGNNYNNSSSGTATTQHQRIEYGDSYNPDCIIDECGWFEDIAETEEKLEEFYDLTGLQPLIIFREYDSSLTSDKAKDSWGVSYYDNNISPENVLLFTYFSEQNEDEVGYMTLTPGLAAQEIFDAETTNLFWENMDDNWFVSYYTLDQVMVNTFVDTAKAVISDTPLLPAANVTEVNGETTSGVDDAATQTGNETATDSYNNRGEESSQEVTEEQPNFNNQVEKQEETKKKFELSDTARRNVTIVVIVVGILIIGLVAFFTIRRNVVWAKKETEDRDRILREAEEEAARRAAMGSGAGAEGTEENPFATGADIFAAYTGEGTNATSPGMAADGTATNGTTTDGTASSGMTGSAFAYQTQETMDTQTK